MPKGPVPIEFHNLLESQAFAFVATLGSTGAPQVSPIWFLWRNEQVLLSLVEGKQRHLNLGRDHRIAVAIAHPADPYRYLEIRGTVQIRADDSNEVFSAISHKYNGSDFTMEPADTVRMVAIINVEHHTFQEPVNLPPPTDRPS